MSGHEQFILEYKEMVCGHHFWSGFVLALALAAGAQEPSSQSPPKNPPPPRSDTNTTVQQPEPQAGESEPGKPPRSAPVNPNESSSRSTITDISPPIGDAQEHPDSEV